MRLSEEVKERVKQLDWGIYFVTAMMSVIKLSCETWLTPTTRPFYVNNASLWNASLPHNTVPNALVWGLAIPFFALICCLEVFFSHNRRVSAWIGLRFFLNFTCALCITSFSNSLIKNYVGELRPDYAERCFGTSALIPPSEYSGLTLTSSSQCVSEGNPLYDTTFFFGRQSFLSGHAASSFSISTSITLYLLWKLFDARGKYGPFFNQLLVLFIFIATSLACFVGCSRIVDNKHHPWDVVGGAAYGSLLSTIVFIYTLISIYQQLIPSRDNSPFSSSNPEPLNQEMVDLDE